MWIHATVWKQTHTYMVNYFQLSCQGNSIVEKIGFSTNDAGTTEYPFGKTLALTLLHTIQKS